MTTWRSNDCWVSYNGSRRAKQCPMEWVLAVRKRSLVALTDPRLVLTTPKVGVIGLPDRLRGVNTTSRKPIRLRPSEDLSVGAQLEVWTRRSAFRYRNGGNYRTCLL
jgi:hypothetical protein